MILDVYILMHIMFTAFRDLDLVSGLSRNITPQTLKALTKQYNQQARTGKIEKGNTLSSMNFRINENKNEYMT